MIGRLSGQWAWLLQRLSAVVMIVYLVYILQHVLFCPPDTFVAWQAWWRGSVMSLSSSVFLLALLFHAWVGGRDVILDYVHHLATRIALLFGLALFLIFCALWGLRIFLVILLVNAS